LKEKGIVFKGEVEDQGFGLTIIMVLPGDVEVMLYEARHPTMIRRHRMRGDCNRPSAQYGTGYNLPGEEDRCRD
jgi:hypothetical protein